ncbi:MAG: ATP-binding cassette domain-containing protein [Acidimicrobiales bacterium]
MISVQGVSVHFGAVKAVDNVSLEIPRNEVRGLLGPNGAGKTTLVRVIATLLQPTQGTALIGGYDIAKDANAVRSMIGLAGQYAAVDDLLTGRENLEIVGALYQLPKSEAKKRADEALERLSLTDAADRLVRTYSGGMRRRLDLGASLVGRPQVLILDEPTTGLDPRTRLELWAFLRDLVSEGATILLTTQYLEEADELADQITVIDAGHIIADGTADELKARVGGDLVTVTPKRRADVTKVSEILAAVGHGAVRVNESELHVSVPVEERVDALVKAAQALDQAGIELSDLGVQRPSLDDVFLAITGHVGTVEEEPNVGKKKRKLRR